MKPFAAALAYLRFAAPDLDAMARFLVDFGLQVSVSESNLGVPVLYGRGTDGSPYCYVVEQGEARFIGMGFYMSSEDDLLALARFDDAAPVGELRTPGGGHYVRFIDPQGYEVDGLFGWRLAEATPPEQRGPLNFAEQRGRTDNPIRLNAGPSHVKRIGHCVVFVKDFQVSETWYKQRFGFLTSDQIFAGSEENVIGAFMRCDQGAKPVDHHTVFLLGNADKAPELQHVAFEVNDWDDLMLGHDHFVSRGYEHSWGIGKHILGSQVFDYWIDPFGNAVEHFTDGDLLSASVPPQQQSIETLLGVQWGPKPAPPPSPTS